MTTPAETLPQGDPRLLDTPVARELLARAIPARIAYVTSSGEPRIVPTWFHWDGEQLGMATWTAGPHITHPARRVEALRAHPEVMVSIDTEDQPPIVLQVRGRAAVEEVDGIPTEYRLAAERYLGADVAAGYLGQFDGVDVR